MNVPDLLTRAMSAVGKSIRYKLGSGGVDPRLASPASIAGECDCSGFVCWAMGLRRQTDHPLYVRFNGGWINTDAIVKDANAATGFFSKIDTPQVGCLVVYGARPPARKVGHVGLVIEVADGRIRKVLHCSAGNSRNGDAICATPPDTFNRAGDAIYAWYEGIDTA